jgi:hypothetical protein
MPTPPKFSFKLLGEAALHNTAILSTYILNLRQALEANKDSPLGPMKEFKPSEELNKIFGLYPLWPRMQQILKNGSKWPLTEISKDK